MSSATDANLGGSSNVAIVNQGTIVGTSPAGFFGFGIAGMNFTNQGTVSVAAGGVVAVIANYLQTPSGSLQIAIGGSPASGQFGQLQVYGPVTLDGSRLTISLSGAYTPVAGDSYQIMTFASRSPATSDFATENGLNLGNGLAFSPTYYPTSLVLVVSAGSQPPPPPTASSLSSASAVEGSPTFTFTITGTNFSSSSIVQWNGSPLTTTFLSSNQLHATVPASDVSEEGMAGLTVVNPAPGGGTSNALLFTVTDAALTAGALTPPAATEDQPFSNVPVLHFTDANPVATATDYTAVVTLGDGNSTTLTSTPSSNGKIVTGSNGGFDVQLSYTYAEELTNQTFSIQVTDAGGTPTSASTSSFSVADAPLTPGGTVTLNTTQVLAFTNVPVATFTDANAAAPGTDFTATIAWGDGSSSPGSVLLVGRSATGAVFQVQGSHTYVLAGTENGTVTIQDVGGQSVTIPFAAAVAPSILVLDPALHGALRISGNGTILIPGAVVVDSSSPAALEASGNAQLAASVVDVVGGYSQNGNAILSPEPTTNAQAIPDPLAGLAPPSPAGLTNYGSVKLTSGSATLRPGVYSQILAAGNGTSLTLAPGTYIIEGGGFSVTGRASVTGQGVTLYNTGSNYPNAGGTYGGISLSGGGTVNLSAPAAGPYQGILIFQSRANTRALSLTGDAMAGTSGTIYAANALLAVRGNGLLQTLGIIVNSLRLSGNGVSTQMSDGASGAAQDTANTGTLLAGALFVYINDPAGYFTANELARIQDAITGLDALLGPYGVSITEVSSSAAANVVLDTGTTSAAGSYADGVLGSYSSTGEITLIHGWNWYDGADPTQIGTDQYDFQTVVTHELGHALGLGESSSSTSAMFGTLAPGMVLRTLTTADLNLPPEDTGADAQRAAVPSTSRITEPPAVAASGDRPATRPSTEGRGTLLAGNTLLNGPLPGEPSLRGSSPLAQFVSLEARGRRPGNPSVLAPPLHSDGPYRDSGTSGAGFPAEEPQQESAAGPELASSSGVSGRGFLATVIVPAPQAQPAEASGRQACDACFTEVAWLPRAMAEGRVLSPVSPEVGDSAAVLAALAVVLGGSWGPQGMATAADREDRVRRE